jgi:hypothetical protein
MTSTESFPLPHAQLTLIQGKPTAAAIRQLKKELYANARSIHSDHGGGLNGHLGLVMPTPPTLFKPALFSMSHNTQTSSQCMPLMLLPR